MTNSILIVDDDPDLRELLSEAFVTENYRTFTASNGEEALSILAKEKINVVLTDYQMPKINGAEMLSKMIEKKFNVPVIILISGFHDLSSEDAYDLGATLVLSKPMDMQILFQHVKAIIENFREPWVLRPPRYENETEIKLKMDGFDSSIKAKLFNIGKGGAFVQATKNFPEVESTAHFKIDFADLTLTGIGAIRWVRKTSTPQIPSGYGLEFLFLDEPGRTQLRKLLLKMPRTQFIPKS
jgi:DNA-binding response OmpR family regulator